MAKVKMQRKVKPKIKLKAKIQQKAKPKAKVKAKVQSTQYDYPRVGVGVLIFNQKGQILLGLRTGKHASGLYASTGGKLEKDESLEACAHRETLEEAGIKIKNLRFLCVVNLKHYKPKHYGDIGFIADWDETSGEPRAMEPDKCAGWGWYDLDNLPQPLMASMQCYIEAYKTGKNFFDF